MNQYIVALSLTLIALVTVGMYTMIRYLGTSPSFGIPVQAIGRLQMRFAFGPRIWVYADIDRLGDVNDVLTSADKPGMDRWNELMRGVLKKIRADDMFLVYGGDEFAFGLRTDDRRGQRHQANARLFCERLQALLRTADYSEAERAALQERLGTPYVTITPAWAFSSGRHSHLRAFRAAQLRVLAAKPKDRKGQRGEILEAVLS